MSKEGCGSKMDVRDFAKTKVCEDVHIYNGLSSGNGLYP